MTGTGKSTKAHCEGIAGGQRLLGSWVRNPPVSLQRGSEKECSRSPSELICSLGGSGSRLPDIDKCPASSGVRVAIPLHTILASDLVHHHQFCTELATLHSATTAGAQQLACPAGQLPQSSRILKATLSTVARCQMGGPLPDDLGALLSSSTGLAIALALAVALLLLSECCPALHRTCRIMHSEHQDAHRRILHAQHCAHCAHTASL